MDSDDDALRADAGQAGAGGVSPDGVKMGTEDRPAQHQRGRHSQQQKADQRHGKRSERSIGQELKLRGDRTGEIVEGSREKPLQDQPRPQCRDQRIDREASDEQAVDQADDRAGGERGRHRRENPAGIALHDPGGKNGGDTDQMGDREVDGTGEDDHGLPDGHDAETHHALQQSADAGPGQLC